jgi:hypothetical protein
MGKLHGRCMALLPVDGGGNASLAGLALASNGTAALGNGSLSRRLAQVCGAGLALHL